MKAKFIYLAVLFFVVSLGPVSGQGQETADVAVTATAIAALDLTATDVAFGTIQVNEASYLQANGSDGTTETNLGSAHSAGSLQIQGESGESVLVSWGDATLNRDGFTDNITFTPTVYNGSSALSSGGTATLTSGDITIDIGGSLEAITTAGTYSTAFGSPSLFTVTYNN